MIKYITGICLFVLSLSGYANPLYMDQIAALSQKEKAASNCEKSKTNKMDCASHFNEFYEGLYHLLGQYKQVTEKCGGMFYNKQIKFSISSLAEIPDINHVKYQEAYTSGYRTEFIDKVDPKICHHQYLANQKVKTILAGIKNRFFPEDTSESNKAQEK